MLLRGFRHAAPVRIFLALLVAVLAVGGPAGATVVSFQGAGWGHGVGLSQYGAKALGMDGASYNQILAKYYTGTQVIPFTAVAVGTFVVEDPKPLWVGLRQDDESVGFTVQSGLADLCFDLTGLCIVAGSGERWRFMRDGASQCAFLRVNDEGIGTTLSVSGSCNGSVRPSSDSTIIEIPVKARSYRYGILRFRPAPSTGRLQTSYQLGVEAYMRGLSEVPESWPAAAVEAQVVASRSLALYRTLERGPAADFETQRKDLCFCTLMDDTSDQVFRGSTGEASHPVWSAAVAATTAEVLVSSGAVALGLYSSSSSGTTENFDDVFGGDALPYLVSVDDAAAFSDSAANPHSSWGAGYDQIALAETYGFSWVSNVLIVERNQSGSAALVRLQGIIDGRPATKTVSGVELREALSLRSTAFDVTVTPVFSDVPAGHTFSGEVLGLSFIGVTTGCTASLYCPDSVVTRGEMATFLVRSLKLPRATGLDTFSDDNGSFFEADIETLYEVGITDGCSPGNYCPGRAVTRAEMAAFLVRAFSLPSAEGDTFSDDDENYFEADIEALVSGGVTSGCGDRSYCPNRAVTRGEMAAFLVRALATG